MSTDIFRPRREPARSIYDAFQREAAKRERKKFEDWTKDEIAAVHLAAVTYAAKHNLVSPTIEQVTRVESYASGHTDYGAKWAYAVADLMTPRPESAAVSVALPAKDWQDLAHFVTGDLANMPHGDPAAKQMRQILDTIQRQLAQHE